MMNDVLLKDQKQPSKNALRLFISLISLCTFGEHPMAFFNKAMSKFLRPEVIHDISESITVKASYSKLG